MSTKIESIDRKFIDLAIEYKSRVWLMPELRAKEDGNTEISSAFYSEMTLAYDEVPRKVTDMIKGVKWGYNGLLLFKHESDSAEELRAELDAWIEEQRALHPDAIFEVGDPNNYGENLYFEEKTMYTLELTN